MMRKQLISLLLALALLCTAAPALAEVTKITLDETTTYQTIESFGTSGAWWAQYAGLWDNPYVNTGRTAREQIAYLLYNREEGIGLTNYRYNLGAGSAESGKGEYSDVNRRAQSFERVDENGVAIAGDYDWTKDEGAYWFAKEVTRLGATEVVLFFNSPLERLTKNGTAQVTAGEKSNIDPENYAAWAVYACDVAEHFLADGIPVKFISPINEPQWEWAGGQEGCHYEPSTIAGVYEAFLAELQRRPALLAAGVELSGPESGEWGGQTVDYVSALLNNKTLTEHFSAIDCHSYWSNTQSKVSFMNWKNLKYPDVKLRMSEWCEMVNGSDLTMDSAIVLSQTLAEDLNILNVVSWATWIGVAPGGYHDGLIYAIENGAGDINIVPLKRLWAYGNYTRFIRPGYTRIATSGGEKLSTVAFVGEENGKKQLVVVLINADTQKANVKLNGKLSGYTNIKVYETSAAMDLALKAERSSNTGIVLPARSVTTVVFSE